MLPLHVKMKHIERREAIRLARMRRPHCIHLIAWIFGVGVACYLYAAIICAAVGRCRVPLT